MRSSYSYPGKGGFRNPHRGPPVNYQVPIPNRLYQEFHHGESALNVKMSTESPPNWGPHMQNQLSYFQWSQLVLDWCRACKHDEGKQAEILFHHLEGTAKSKISAWLEHPSKLI